MASASFLRPERPTFVDGVPVQVPFGWPKTEKAWQRRYNWLEDAYLGAGYSAQDHQALRLFRALDASGDVIQETQRLTRDFQHVVDVNVRAIAAHRLSLELARGQSAAGRLEDAQRIWRRSSFEAKRETYTRWGCGMGDMWLEAVWSRDGVRLVGYDPRFVTPEYSDDGLSIDRVVIRIPFFDEDLDQDPASALRVYQRVITPTHVAAGELLRGDMELRGLGEDGYAHSLGVCPVVHVPYLEWGPPGHGLHCAPALEPCLAQVDSHLCQVRAVANRYGNPILAIQGAKLGNDSDIHKFGRTVTLPPGADAKYLEAGAGVIASLWQTVREYQQINRDTIPEFLFSGAGANTSGRALDLRANEFKLKAESARSRYYDAWERVTQFAQLLEDQSAYDPDDHWYRITAPPVLPIDRAERMALVRDARDRGLLTREDSVKHLQAIGLIDHELAADEYVVRLEAEDPAPVAAEPDPAADDTRADPEPGPVDVGPDTPEGVDKVQDTALNGAQVQSAVDIVERVAAGRLPRESGVQMLMTFFSIDERVAETLMGEVGRSFVIEAPAAVPAGTPPPPATTDNSEEASDDEDPDAT